MSMCRSLAAAAIAFTLVLPLATAAMAVQRIALVIGNDQYQNLPRLAKAVADATSYADALKAKGFDQVVLKTDLTRTEMDETVAAFIDQIQPGDTAVFAYAGHGWSDGNQNFIVGTDAPSNGSQQFLARVSIALKNGNDGIIDEMDQKGAALKVAIVDACRDNPFTPPPGKRGFGLSRGLARVADPPRGTFVIFSAGAGQSALDRLSDADSNPNSVFTRVFVSALRTDLTLQAAIKTTQEQVVALAKSVQSDQTPAYYDEVIGSACLSASCDGGGTASLQPPPPTRLTRRQPRGRLLELDRQFDQSCRFRGLSSRVSERHVRLARPQSPRGASTPASAAASAATAAPTTSLRHAIIQLCRRLGPGRDCDLQRCLSGGDGQSARPTVRDQADGYTGCIGQRLPDGAGALAAKPQCMRRRHGLPWQQLSEPPATARPGEHRSRHRWSVVQLPRRLGPG